MPSQPEFPPEFEACYHLTVFKDATIPMAAQFNDGYAQSFWCREHGCGIITDDSLNIEGVFMFQERFPIPDKPGHFTSMSVWWKYQEVYLEGVFRLGWLLQFDYREHLKSKQ